jgi:hypothetical protein
MNCKDCQEEIREALAAGAGPLPHEVAEHRESCPMCSEFCETQASLFRAMDSGMQTMVNQAIPFSLIPGVRARLREQRITHSAWLASWSFAVVAAVAIVAVSTHFVRPRSEGHPELPASGSVTFPSFGNPALAAPSPPEPAIILPSRTYKRGTSAVPSPIPTESTPEVIVLAEERQAFAQFVAELPEEKDVALALTRPAPAERDVPVEIALLLIGNVEVTPLEGTQVNSSAN